MKSVKVRHTDYDTNIITIEGDDNLLSIFGDYIPVSGLYVCGTYYALKLIRKKKERNRI